MSSFNELYVNKLHVNTVTVGDSTYTTLAVIKNSANDATIAGSGGTLSFSKIGRQVTMTWALNTGAATLTCLDAATTYYISDDGLYAIPAEFRPPFDTFFPYAYNKGGDQSGSFKITNAGLMRFEGWGGSSFGTGDPTVLPGAVTFTWFTYY